MLVLAKNRFIELLKGGNIVEKGDKFYTLAGVEVKPDEPIIKPKPKKSAPKKVAEDEHNSEELPKD